MLLRYQANKFPCNYHFFFLFFSFLFFGGAGGWQSLKLMVFLKRRKKINKEIDSFFILINVYVLIKLFCSTKCMYGLGMSHESLSTDVTKLTINACLILNCLPWIWNSSGLWVNCYLVTLVSLLVMDPLDFYV